MGRVHHEFEIRRRYPIAQKSQYNEYLPELREDFCYICGYCGKSERLTCKGFEIDHFVPKSVAPEKETDYNNLVYSCFTCNRKKGSKWPTKDKDVINDGAVGFIDPATSEYDSHLEKNDIGEVCGKSNVGQYMCSKVFKFHLRPMKELAICHKILLRMEEINSKRDSLPKEKLLMFCELHEKLENLKSLLFEKKE